MQTYINGLVSCCSCGYRERLWWCGFFCYSASIFAEESIIVVKSACFLCMLIYSARRLGERIFNQLTLGKCFSLLILLLLFPNDCLKRRERRAVEEKPNSKLFKAKRTRLIHIQILAAAGVAASQHSKHIF